MFKIIFRNLYQRPFLIISSLVVVACSVFLLASISLVQENIDRIQVGSEQGAKVLEDRHDLTVYLDSSLNGGQLESVATEIKAMGLVSRVKMVSSEQSKNVLKNQLGVDVQTLFEGSRLPSVFYVYFSQSSIPRKLYLGLVNDVQAITGVLDVDNAASLTSQGALVGIKSQSFSWARLIYWVAFAVIALVTLLIIRLVFEAIRRDISTLKILGMSRWSLYLPMLANGMFVGILGTCLGLFMLWGATDFVIPEYLNQIFPDSSFMMSLSQQSIIKIMSMGVLSSFVGCLFIWPFVHKTETYS